MKPVKNSKKLHHVGVVVKDIDKAIACFEKMGIGPFSAGSKKTVAVCFKGELHGRPATWTTTISNAQLGDVQLELLEPTEGAQSLKETLDKTGEGLHHIGFLTDNLKDEEANLKKAGVGIWTKAQGQFLYSEPSATNGVAIEFREIHM